MSEDFEALLQLPLTLTQPLPIGEVGENKVNLFEYQYQVPQAATVATFQVYETDLANIGRDISVGTSQHVTRDHLNPSLGTYKTQELPSLTLWIPRPHCDWQAKQHPGSQSDTQASLSHSQVSSFLFRLCTISYFMLHEGLDCRICHSRVTHWGAFLIQG
jgi:hypothetical protein